MRRTTKTIPRTSDRGIIEGYRSGLEEAVAAQLSSAGVPVQYEQHTLHYTQPLKARRYTPDFILPNGIIVETKGRFVTADRQKHLHIQACHPNLDIRFVFSNSNARIGKASKTTYAMWCTRAGFTFADRLVPMGWLDEDFTDQRRAALMLAIPGWVP